MAVLTSLPSPSPHAAHGRRSSTTATCADAVTPETVVVGRVRLPLGAPHVPQRTADPGLLGPAPDMRAMAGPGGGASPGQVGPTATGRAARVGEGEEESWDRMGSSVSLMRGWIDHLAVAEARNFYPNPASLFSRSQVFPTPSLRRFYTQI